ncbi:hypothetical protein Hanom_Chr03g00255551 [Helianthus anomalus]
MPRQRSEVPGRQYPLREAPLVPLTLDTLCERMDHLYGDLRGTIFTGRHKQEDMLRYMMGHMGINVPDHFQA